MKNGKNIAIFGALLQLAPIIGVATGMAQLVLGMFSTLRDVTVSGTASEEKISHELGFTFIASGTGILIGLVGIILLMTALFYKRYRAKWFYTFMMTYSVVLLFFLPLGTVAGIGFLLYLTKRKDEFHKESNDANQAVLTT